MKKYNIYLTSILIKHKLYGNLHSLAILTYWEKDLSMDFIIGLLILTKKKDGTYNSILAIVNRLIKIVNYEPIKITINALSLVEIIIKAVVQYPNQSDLLTTN